MHCSEEFDENVKISKVIAKQDSSGYNLSVYIHAPVKINELTIINGYGKKIVNNICNSAHHSIDISNFEQGLYFIQVQYFDGTFQVNGFIKY